jgi:Ca2+-binding EF-hand superfamily protein
MSSALDVVAMFSAMDTDGSGEVTIDEFRAFMLREDPSVSEEQIRRHFESLDQDGDGGLSLKEFTLEDFSTSLDKRLKKCAMKVFETLDVDGSGGLEPEEINGWLTSVCGWTEQEVEHKLWELGGVWAGKKSVEFPDFLRAATHFHWPIGDFDHAEEMQRVSRLAEEKTASKDTVELHVVVECASDLPVKDWFSWSSDPYCVVTFNRQRRQTETKHSTTNPQWCAAFSFLIRDPTAPLTPLR